MNPNVKSAVNVGLGMLIAVAAVEIAARALVLRPGPVRARLDAVDKRQADRWFGILRPKAPMAVAVIGSSLSMGEDGGLAQALSRLLGPDVEVRNNAGAGSFMGDLLVRAEWPTSGFALEGMMINLGASLSANGVARRTDTLFVQTTQLDDFREELDNLNFDVRDTVDLKVSIPRVWRVTATSWANTILQLDGALSGSWGGDFDMPTEVALNTTWRFIRHVPLRAGLVLGGRQGIGYQGGLAVESQNFLFRMSAQSLGGWMSNATGVGGRLDLGFFF